MKKLLLALVILPTIVLAETEVSPPTKFTSFTCPQPVTRGCTVTIHGLFGSTCTHEDFVKNLPCMDVSYQQKLQYEENYNSNYPNNQIKE